MGMHVIVIGDPIEGFCIVGPFKTCVDAIEWALACLGNADWWATPLAPQSDYERTPLGTED